MNYHLSLLNIVDLKERLVDGEVHSYSWLLAQSMWADMMMKEMRLPLTMEDVIMKNVVNLPKTEVNEVKAVRTEIRMSNI